MIPALGLLGKVCPSQAHPRVSSIAVGAGGPATGLLPRDCGTRPTIHTGQRPGPGSDGPGPSGTHSPAAGQAPAAGDRPPSSGSRARARACASGGTKVPPGAPPVKQAATAQFIHGSAEDGAAAVVVHGQLGLRRDPAAPETHSDGTGHVVGDQAPLDAIVMHSFMVVRMLYRYIIWP